MTPRLVLSFYDVGIILQRHDPNTGIFHEYAVDPSHLAAAIGNNLTLTTGFLGDDIVFMTRTTTKTTLVSYRSPRKTGIYLENVPEPLRVPLPGLIMIRTTETGQTPTHYIFAVKERPTSLQVKLFHAPLPNVYNHGRICWGSIPIKQLDDQTTLKQDWSQFFATAFGNHGVNAISRSHSTDIRKLLIALNDSKKKHYPIRDLVDTNRTLADLFNSMEDPE